MKTTLSRRAGGKLLLSPRDIGSLIRQALLAWVDDSASSMGAAIAYYTVFSLAPLLILVISVAGLIFGRDAVQGEIVSQLQGLMGHEGAVVVEGLIKSASEPKTSSFAALVSIGLLLFGATTVLAEIQNSLDRIWHVPTESRSGGIWEFVRTRLLSFGIVLGIAFLLLVSLVFSAAVAALGNWWGSHFKGWETLLQLINFTSSLALSCLLFAMIYKFMPTIRIAWRDVWIGSVVTAALFEMGKFGIGLYLGKSGVTSAFGAAGSLVVLLIWVYYSAQIFLLGAEFTKVYAKEHGSGAIGRTSTLR
ncbi:MAG: YihY family inner membrane protein [Betaproteobacteria bacterium]|nr:YihY family inner membrane protein [Betaproteobacteria bacterium]